ncbi:MAG: superoxide dismutase [Capnocytophaga sp.]|uniref:superoxide dismutase n=1 Tax=Capnocytophaga sp. TaxID=44737 RepID=UPI003FA160A4
MSFTLPQLPYAYDALEPYIDARTMEIHHTKHHNAYTTNLNAAAEAAGISTSNIEELLGTLDMNNAALRNNAGGHYNHCLFWELLSANGGGQPTGELAQAIDEAFGSFEGFKEAFSKAAATRFGSGWAWLCVHKGGKVEVCSTPNQDNPLMPGAPCHRAQPILGLDVWEHAYYLHYQNRRPEYIQAFFNIINWEKVAELYRAGK